MEKTYFEDLRGNTVIPRGFTRVLLLVYVVGIVGGLFYFSLFLSTDLFHSLVAEIFIGFALVCTFVAQLVVMGFIVA